MTNTLHRGQVALNVWQRRGICEVSAQVPIGVVVDLLAAHWRTRLGRLDSYLRSTFGLAAPHPLPVRVHLSQMSDGSVNPPDIGHMFAAVWQIDADGVRMVPLDFEWRTRWDTDESGTYYLMTSYSFVAGDGELLLSERYGPGLVHRSHGRAVGSTVLAFEWTT